MTPRPAVPDASSTDRPAVPIRPEPPRLATATHPVIYEINTWPWLHELSAAAGRPVDLGTVPEKTWDELAGLGVDAVWLMGVWRRSPAGIGSALANPG